MTKRNLFKTVGGALVASVLPSDLMAKNVPSMTTLSPFKMLLSKEELVERYNQITRLLNRPTYMEDFYFTISENHFEMRCIQIDSVQNLIDLQKTPGFRYLLGTKNAKKKIALG